MSKADRSNVTLIAIAVLIVVALFNQSALPIVHMADGKCVRVTVEGDDGEMVQKDCSTVDLVHDVYDVMQVASADEIAEIELTGR